MFRPFLALCELNVDHIEQHARFDYRIFLSLNRSNFFLKKRSFGTLSNALKSAKDLKEFLNDLLNQLKMLIHSWLRHT